MSSANVPYLAIWFVRFGMVKTNTKCFIIPIPIRFFTIAAGGGRLFARSFTIRTDLYPKMGVAYVFACPPAVAAGVRGLWFEASIICFMPTRITGANTTHKTLRRVLRV